MFKSKKILAFVMLLIATAPILFFIGFLVKQKTIQHEMKEKLESSLLQTISVNTTDFKWIKKNKEIIVDGRLFDVKEYSIKNDSVIFSGLYDEAESQLEKDMAGIMDQEKSETLPLEELILEFILAPAVKKNSEIAIFPFANSIKKLFPSYNEVAVTQSLVVHTPPPNV